MALDKISNKIVKKWIKLFNINSMKIIFNFVFFKCKNLKYLYVLIIKNNKYILKILKHNFNKFDIITNVIFYKLFIKLEFNNRNFIIYDISNQNILKFDGLKNSSLITDYYIIEGFILLEVNDYYYYIYNSLSLKLIIFKGLKPNDKVTFFYIHNKYLKIEVNFNKYLIYKFINYNNWKLIKIKSRNITSLRIKKSHWICELKTNELCILNKFNYKRVNLEKLLKNEKIIFFETVNKFYKLTLNSKYLIIFDNYFNKMNFKNIKNCKFITKFKLFREFFIWKIIDNVIILNKNNLKKINLKGIKQNDQSTEVNLTDNFFCLKINFYKSFIFSQISNIKWCINKIKKSDMVTNFYQIGNILRIQINDFQHIILDSKCFNEVYFKGIKSTDNITEFFEIRGFYKIQVNSDFYLLYNSFNNKRLNIKSKYDSFIKKMYQSGNYFIFNMNSNHNILFNKNKYYLKSFHCNKYLDGIKFFYVLGNCISIETFNSDKNKKYLYYNINYWGVYKLKINKLNYINEFNEKCNFFDFKLNYEINLFLKKFWNIKFIL